MPEMLNLDGLSEVNKTKVRRLVESLKAEEQNRNKSIQKLTFSWAGALKGMFDEMSSVDLQHKISNEWR